MDISSKRRATAENGRANKVSKFRPLVSPLSSTALSDLDFERRSVSPWEDYQLETSLESGCYLAFLKKYPHTAVLVRQIPTSIGTATKLKPVLHRNVVQLCRVYIEDHIVSMIYEMTFVSLKDILSFRPHWSIADTAAICEGTLFALKHLHGVLEVCHGGLLVENIRVDLSGAVKIANVGDSLLRGQQDFQGDLRSLAQLVRRLAAPGELTLPPLKDFIAELERGQSPAILLQHIFLKSCNGPEQLQRCVWTWLATRLIFLGRDE